jgi:hypothetical protein
LEFNKYLLNPRTGCHRPGIFLSPNPMSRQFAVCSSTGFGRGARIPSCSYTGRISLRIAGSRTQNQIPPAMQHDPVTITVRGAPIHYAIDPASKLPNGAMPTKAAV